MDAKGWRNKIRKLCQSAGTYEKEYEPVIETLAGILERKARAEEQFAASGGNPVVKHTNKGGATNVVKNPALAVIMELDTQALAYWRDLGLTPAGMRKLRADVIKNKADGSFEKLLSNIL